MLAQGFYTDGDTKRQHRSRQRPARSVPDGTRLASALRAPGGRGFSQRRRRRDLPVWHCGAAFRPRPSPRPLPRQHLPPRRWRLLRQRPSSPAPRRASTTGRTRRRTQGDWHYAESGGGEVASSAQFAGAGMPLFVVACLRGSGMVRLERMGRDPAAGAGTLVVRTEFGDRSFAARGQGASIASELPAHDGFLDDIAYSKGRFAVETAGAAPLYLPSWPEISRGDRGLPQGDDVARGSSARAPPKR